MNRSRAMARPWLDYYEPGVPADLPTVPVPFHCLLDAACAVVPGRPAITYMGATRSYAELDLQVARAAAAMQSSGIGPGEVVVVALPTCPAAVIAVFAALRAGALCLLMQPNVSPDIMAEVLGHHGARVVVAGEGVTPLRVPGQWIEVATAAELPPLLRLIHRVRRGQARATAPGAIEWRSWLRGAGPALPLPAAVGSEPAIAIADPNGKVVEFRHDQLAAGAVMLQHWLTDARPGEETWLAAVDLTDPFGLAATLGTATALQARIVLVPRVEPAAVAAAIKSTHPGIVTSSPGIAAAAWPLLTGGHVPAGRELRTWLTAARGSELWEGSLAPAVPGHGGGLGVPEGPGLVTCNPVNGRQVPGSVGVPLPGAAARVVDGSGFQAAPGAVGFLEVRGPNLPRPDRWLRTVIRAHMDEAGFVYAVGLVAAADRAEDSSIRPGASVPTPPSMAAQGTGRHRSQAEWQRRGSAE